SLVVASQNVDELRLASLHHSRIEHAQHVCRVAKGLLVSVKDTNAHSLVVKWIPQFTSDELCHLAHLRYLMLIPVEHRTSNLLPKLLLRHSPGAGQAGNSGTEIARHPRARVAELQPRIRIIQHLRYTPVVRVPDLHPILNSSAEGGDFTALRGAHSETRISKLSHYPARIRRTLLVQHSGHWRDPGKLIHEWPLLQTAWINRAGRSGTSRAWYGRNTRFVNHIALKETNHLFQLALLQHRSGAAQDTTCDRSNTHANSRLRERSFFLRKLQRQFLGGARCESQRDAFIQRPDTPSPSRQGYHHRWAQQTHRHRCANTGPPSTGQPS